MIESEARKLLASAPQGEFAETLQAVLRGLPGGVKLSIQQVAQIADMSVRSLHRRLAAEGQSFTQLADELRAEIAIEMLKHSDAPVAEIAQKLGYSRVFNFTRAFMRWTGKLPAAYRPD